MFGFRLFTVLAYDAASKRLVRLRSNRPDINPVGGVKRVTQSRWVDQVLRRGEIFIGSTREDVKAVFSDYALLWSIGCASALNIPVRKSGVTIGTLNLLGDAGQYDGAEAGLALTFAQLVVAPIEASSHRLRDLPTDGDLEHV
ncbi:MAG: GAF domain-containing protein [Pseudomonadota bacterium]